MFLEIDKKTGDALALLDRSGERLTYQQLNHFIEHMSKILPERCLVFILCKNNVGAAAIYLASLCNRIVPLMLGASVDCGTLEELKEKYKPSYIWKPSDAVCEGENVVFRSLSCSLVSCGVQPYKMNSELSLLLSTSGSTGSPKLVRHSYENLEANARNIAEFFQLGISDKPMLDLPIQYAYGLSVLNSHIYAGATVLLSDLSMMQQRHWDFFKENEATSITGVPYTYEMLKRFRIFKMDLPSLKLLSQGGGKLSEALHREYAQFAQDTGRKFVVTYGQTEGSARMAFLPPEDALQKIGSIGKAIPGGEMYLVDESGDAIQRADCIGELVYKGPNVTMGYAECSADLMLGDERKGILFTGDMAKRDEDRYFYIVGRKKRFLKLFGNRVSLDDCEQAIQKKFATECACTGIDDRMNIYVTGHVDSEAIIQFLSKKTQIHHKAFCFITIPELPRNEAGKVLYEKIENILHNCSCQK